MGDYTYRLAYQPKPRRFHYDGTIAGVQTAAKWFLHGMSRVSPFWFSFSCRPTGAGGTPELEQL